MHGHHNNAHLPLYIRIACYAEDHHGQALRQGQLRAAVDPYARPSEISRAIETAKRNGLLHPTSSARCLWFQTKASA